MGRFVWRVFTAYCVKIAAFYEFAKMYILIVVLYFIIFNSLIISVLCKI
ncbi:hypothetical protein B0I21_106308 [Sphingobacterium paludis]|uniref:Uncharacterized protein n=1 Tax=Sphingobacterium paludis TaxID=1476465 RepID=A0A4R7CW47_9SPHI|nr:hypothetical protein B0I21_106308 [Sphingobacterium paludis]